MRTSITILNGVKHLFLLSLANKKRILYGWHQFMLWYGSMLLNSGELYTFVLCICVPVSAHCVHGQDISSRRQCSNNVPMSKNSKNWNLMRCTERAQFDPT